MAIDPAGAVYFTDFNNDRLLRIVGGFPDNRSVPGTPPELPAASNLTLHANGLAGWTEADFIRVIREGKRPDGRELHGFMPWRIYGAMTDEELQALWRHFESLPPRPGAGRRVRA